MKKPLPPLTNDKDAEDFVSTADLTQFDLTSTRKMSFEFSPKTKQVNMRFSEQLLEAVKAKAAEHGMSYQRFIRHALESALDR